MFPSTFRGEVNREETRVMWLSFSGDRTIVAGVALTWYRTVTDGRTQRNGRADLLWLIQRSSVYIRSVFTILIDCAALRVMNGW